MTAEQFDALVVGAGQGGLTCAGYLAVTGHRVLVLEQHTVGGGNAQVFRRRGRYEFDVGTHYVGECGPDGVVRRVYEALGLGDRIAFREMDRDGFDRIVLPSTRMRVPVGWEAYRERLVATLPDEADGIRQFVDLCARVHATQRHALLGHLDPNPVPAGEHTPIRALSTIGAAMREAGLSSRARTLLAGQSANYGLGPDEVSVLAHAVVLGSYLQGAYYPVGGGQMFGATLVEAIEAHGGELRTRSLVTRILVENGRAAGVVLADGQVLRAPVVVSNADYRRTVRDLVGTRHFPEVYAARAERATMALPLAVLYLALEPDTIPPRESNIWWYETDDIDEMYAELNTGPFDVPRFGFISSGSAKSGTAADHHTVEVMTTCPREYATWVGGDEGAMGYGYRADRQYLARKERLDEALFAIAERALGPLSGKVLHREVATPLTQVRFTRSTGGCSYGIGATPRQFGPTRPAHATAIPGLYLVGASTESGFGIVGTTVGGVRCAEAITGEPLLVQAYAGKVLGDAGRLPDRPAGWDPLLASRGSRSARHPRRANRLSA